MKRTLLVTLGFLGLTAVVLSVAVWEPWASDEREREHEVAWIEKYVAWSDRIDAALAAGDYGLGADCDYSYSREVGAAPTRLTAAARIARAGCSRFVSALSDLDASEQDLTEWHAVRDETLADLTDRRTRIAALRSIPELAAYAAPLAGTRPEVFCWSSTHWEELSEEWRLIRVDELWPIGLADQERRRIHLAPQVCDPLGRFFGGDYAPHINFQSFELAEALVTLAHEAEHLRSPEATEAQVECIAIQRVRDLVRDAGRSKSYEDLMTGLAWDVGYPNEPAGYSTAECHDGSELDVRPETDIFP